jgi:hypothetical protein
MTVATQPERTAELLRLLGDPRQVADELRQARRSAAVLSADEARLLEEYGGEWIALHDGRVVARAPTIQQLLVEVGSGAPARRTRILVRFVDPHPPALVL